MPLGVMADQHATPITLEFLKKGISDGNKPLRAPSRIDLSVCYDETSHLLTVEGDESLDCEVSLRNSADAMVDYSSAIPASFDLSGLPSGTYTVVIENDSWVATGEIEL